jgi:hypothetical protein
LKKLLTTAFLLLLFTAQVGYYFIYSIQQRIIKDQVERKLLAQIPEASLEKIIAEDFAGKIFWKEKGKEFSLDGVMYDVVRIKNEDGKTSLYCINDKQEKLLIDELVKMVNANHSPQQEKNTGKSPLPDLVFTSNEQELNLVAEPSAYPSYFETTVSSFEEIIIPPPKA